MSHSLSHQQENSFRSGMTPKWGRERCHLTLRGADFLTANWVSPMPALIKPATGMAMT